MWVPFVISKKGREDMNPKRALFCEEYAKTLNGPESYKKVYGPKKQSSLYQNSHRLLQNPEIKQRLKELTAEAHNSNIATIAEIQERLTAIIRMETKEEVLMVEGVEQGVTETKKYDKAPAIKDVVAAADKLAKMQGAYVGNNNVVVTVPVFSDEEKLED